MTLRRSLIAGVLLVLASLAGCQPLRYEKAYDLNPHDSQTLDFDAPRYEQKVKVEVSSPGAPVSAYLVESDKKEAAEKDLDHRKAPAASLGGQDNSETISFEATVPAKTAYALLIHNGSAKKATVQVKVTGR